MPKQNKQHKKQNRKPRSTPKSNILRGVGTYSRPRRLKGHGGYAEDIGGGIGSWLGQKAGSLFRSITGLGGYSVRQNTLAAKPSDPPIVSNTRSGTRIQHREYIMDISGSNAFTIQSFPINPGISMTFPWGSSVANAFEEYKLHGCLFEFKSTSADALNSTNTALGTVIMATEYNPLHGTFSAKRDMENYVYSTSSAPSVSALHPIECARDMNVLGELFVRNVPLTGADLRFSDIGNFQIATVGMQATAVIGELWITYDIEFIKPKLPDSFSATGPAHYVFSNGSVVVPSPTVGPPNTSNLFGVAVQNLALRGTGVSPVSLSTNTMTWNQTGRYFINMTISGTAAAVSTASVALGAAVTGQNLMPQIGALNGIMQSPVAGVSTVTVSYQLFVDIPTLVGATVAWTCGTIPSTVTGLDLWIVPLPQGFTVPAPSATDELYCEVDDLKKQIHALAIKYQQSCRDDDDYIVREDDDQSDPDISPGYLPPRGPRLRRSPPSSMTTSTSNLASALLERLTARA